jgi:hypothetical protein
MFSVSSSKLLLPALGILLLAFTTGCEDELNFSTGEMEVYTGEVVDAGFLTARPAAAQHLFAPGTVMELQLDMRALDTEPGAVNSSDGMFDHVELVTLPEVARDRVSDLEIPGNFMRSLIFLAPVSDPELAGADAVLFVSLGQSEETVEVRALAAAGEGRRAFGVFQLTLQTIEEETAR